MRALIPLTAKHAVRRVLRRPSANARRYLRPGLTVDEFLSSLTADGVRYAVLRWFDTLPEVEPGGDIDMLVADEDLAAVEARLTPYRSPRAVQKVDLYTAGGLPRTQFGGAPYLSAPLAAQVLDQAVLLAGRYRVPSPSDHFDSLAFHAVHHKGAVSGLPRRAGEAPERPPGRIAEMLDRLNQELDRGVDLTLDGLDGYLKVRGLGPTPDQEARLAGERRRLYSSS